jgi:hypothetical protein
VPGNPYVWPIGPKTVQVIGVTGWTVPPPDARRGVALLVWDHFMALNGDLRRAKSSTANGQQIVFVADGRNPYNDRIPSAGIPEVDEIVSGLYRDNFTPVG